MPNGVLEIRPASKERFDDVATMLAPKVADSPACWCLSYRLTSAENHRLAPADRAQVVRELCGRDIAPGLLAYIDETVVGWCAVGPRSSFGRLVRSRTIPAFDDQPVWSVVCFVVRPGHRRQGVASALLLGAVDYAASCGAEIVEGYPVDPKGTRVSTPLAYIGTTSMFERAGFVRVEQTAARSGGLPRWRMRRSLESVEIRSITVEEPR